jgi:hypothetical protein
MTTAIGGIIRERLRNQPNGFAGLDANGDLLGTLVNRAMTYAELMDGVVPEVGEFVYCTDTRDVHVGDGVTIGGRFITSPAKVVPILNTGVEIDDAGELEIASVSLKADCEYRLSGLLIARTLFTASTNNMQIKHTASNHAGPFTQGIPLVHWSEANAPNVGAWANLAVVNDVAILSYPGTPEIPPGQNIILLEARIKRTSDITGSVWLKQITATGVAFIQTSTLSIRRVA